jgi:hypothetical protein
MSREITSALNTALRAKVVRAGFMFEMETTGATVYLTTRPYHFTYGGQTWLANNWLLPTQNIEETIDLQANTMSIYLQGIDSTAVSLVLASLTRAKKGKLLLAGFNEDRSIIADPFEVFSGFFDGAELSDDGENCKLVVSYENQLLRGQNWSQFRYTTNSQQALYAGDKGFDYAALTPDWSGFWGKAARPKFSRKRRNKKGRN